MRLLKAILLLPLAASMLYGAGKTRNVILVTADGLRWQELFNGIDPLLMNEKEAGMQDAGELRKRLWSDSASERRKALMPFFWTKLVPRGVVLGNPEKNSSVKVSNSFRVSYPGYSEILTGRAQDNVIKGNTKIQNPTETVLEFLRGKLNVDMRKVALFGSWDTFPFIGEKQPGTVFINAGYRAAEGAGLSPRIGELSRLQFQVLTGWDSVRHDYVTFEMALEYLKTVRPRVLHIALGETDDWAHGKRYDRTLETITYFDKCLENLWRAIESIPEYRGSTSLVVTVDHGRGSTLSDWTSHGAKVPGAERIWMAIAGPDTPAVGEAANTGEAFQRDVAPTMIDLLGFDYRQYAGVLGQPVKQAR